MAEAKFDLLVCTCDSYEDAWTPFFTLLKKHWPDAERLRIILTTETKDFSFPGLRIVCARTGVRRRGKSKPWGARMIASLDLVKAPLVLWMLDDFFVNRPVCTAVLRTFAAKMCIHDWDSVELIPLGDKKGTSLGEEP